ncbi:MAG TPA: ankyrin repeat domain-containing protein [Planctomycetes bacterium]|nr:ankyrin repeat domain-containing protein [Planctomycetota bacterium]
MNRIYIAVLMTVMICGPGAPGCGPSVRERYDTTEKLLKLLVDGTESGLPTVAEIRRLIRQGADVNAGREHEISGHSFESTPLLVAVTNPSLEISTLLIEAGADVNCKGPWGFTPLMLAVFLESSSPEIVTLLIEAGADVNARTEDEPGTSSVLQCALLAESPDPEIIQLLKDAGAK